MARTKEEVRRPWTPKRPPGRRRGAQVADAAAAEHRGRRRGLARAGLVRRARVHADGPAVCSTKVQTEMLQARSASMRERLGKRRRVPPPVMVKAARLSRCRRPRRHGLRERPGSPRSQRVRTPGGGYHRAMPASLARTGRPSRGAAAAAPDAAAATGRRRVAARRLGPADQEPTAFGDGRRRRKDRSCDEPRVGAPGGRASSAAARAIRAAGVLGGGSAPGSRPCLRAAIRAATVPASRGGEPSEEPSVDAQVDALADTLDDGDGDDEVEDDVAARHPRAAPERAAVGVGGGVAPATKQQASRLDREQPVGRPGRTIGGYPG